MKNKILKIVKSTYFNIAVIFACAFLVLYFTLRNDAQTILETFKNVSIPGFIGLLLLMIFERYLLGVGLAKEVRLTHKKYTNKQGFINAYVAGLFNNITPGASGGQIAQGAIFKRQGIPVSNSIGVLWLDFIVYQSTMCLFVLILIVLKFNYFYTQYSSFFFVVILGFFVAVGIIGFLWVAALSSKFYRWVSSTGLAIGNKLHIIKDVEKSRKSLEQQIDSF